MTTTTEVKMLPKKYHTSQMALISLYMPWRYLENNRDFQCIEPNYPICEGCTHFRRKWATQTSEKQ